MRVSRIAVALFAIGVACKSTSSTSRPSSRVDSIDLWALAPDGTVTAAVVTMHGYERLGAAMRVLEAQATELAARDEGDAPTDDVFIVTRTRPAQDIGLVPGGSAAAFYGPWGAIEVWQTADSRRFNAARHGVTKDGVDHFNNDVCKEVRGVYACTEKLENLELLGNGEGLTPPKTPSGMRPDLVIVSIERSAAPMDVVTALIEAAGPLVVTAQLDDGIVLVDATIPGRPHGGMAALAAAPRHRVRTEGLSGFAAASLDYLAAIPPPHNDTQKALIQVASGEAWVPADGESAQITLGLRDPAPVALGVATCGAEDSDGMFTNDPAQPDACRLTMPPPFGLHAIVWVENKTLRIAGSRGPAPPPSSTLATPAALAGFLGDRPWTFVGWARGVAATSPPRSAGVFGVATPELLRAASHLNELAIGVDVRADGIELRAAIRMSSSEPEAVQAAFARALEGEPMTLPEALGAFARAHPTSRLADDVRAGASGGQVVWYATLMAGAMLIATATERSASME